ncbi:ninein-like protein [Cylas formicarius]|uniref:ninein-like protein n=1 Tax=Cylas formicarius TaxID=197179 RepID=UPI002958BBE6|nr:ninein-like protein [Cylas formicarius]
MDHFLLDPYEQQLLKVFDSHDRGSSGSLDWEGLTQLCQTLQLEDQTSELIRCLLKDKQSRVTFIEFKDALLALLGNMQNNKSHESPKKEVGKSSPDREVSPKFVYGTKKYGRRSRPRSDEVTPIFSEENDLSQSKSLLVQRSNSQSEVSTKKRKTNYKLKRCTSLPGCKDLDTSERDFITSNLVSEPELVCTEEMLREAWKKLGVGEDGYLNKSELVSVCDAIGLHKLADGVLRQLSDKVSLNYDQKISFNDVLGAIQQDETWFDVLNETTNNNEAVNVRCSTEELFPDSRTFHYITLGPDGNGIIKADILIEMWENVGIHSPKELIHELGFNTRKISIFDLADVLEKQTRAINESTRSQYQNPHVTLLQANLCLYQSEIRCLKSILEQLQAEREKLKCDVVEANNRATLLAQEVDDNHSKMEQSAINQVRLLEQRHAHMLKDITSQFARDKDQLTSINQSLEERILSLEMETAKLKNDLCIAQKYSLNVEKENHMLSFQITDLQKDKEMLTCQIEMLETEKQTVRDEEREENEILLAKLSELQLKNSELKDKNDEMESEIETLTNQVMSMKSKASSTPTRSYNTLDQSMDDSILVTCEGVGVGSKRRSDCSPSKDVHLLRMTDGSPRLGKLRKFCKPKMPESNLEVSPSSGESGFDTEPDSLSTSTCDNNEAEISRLHAKIIFLEQVLVQHNIPVPSYEETETNTEYIMQLTGRVKELETIIENARKEIDNMINKDCVKCDRLKELCQRLEQTAIDRLQNTNLKEKEVFDQSIQTDFDITFVEERVKIMEDENRVLREKCTELEDCIELLKNEYEKCEDYWQNKVDEERQFFEIEQKISGEKLNEVLIKMKEYEEQYANQDMIDNRLPPIIEAESLEKQFTDLEQEFETYKIYHEVEMFKKDEEIKILKEKLTELAVKQKEAAEASVQTHFNLEQDRVNNKMKKLSIVVETMSRLPEEMVAQDSNDIWDRQSTQTTKSEAECSTASSLPAAWNVTIETSRQNNSLGVVPSTSSSQNSTPCRPKRSRKHEKNIYKKNSQEKNARKSEVTRHQQHPMESKVLQGQENSEQTVAVAVSTFNHLLSRNHYLELRLRHLQMCMKQQHFRNEHTLQSYWHMFRGEKSDLEAKLQYCQEKLNEQMRICSEQLDRLHKNDLFVKDLYVENTYLFAHVERLEQQCRTLAQANATSNSM